jgi:hypothetical protein
MFNRAIGLGLRLPITASSVAQVAAAFTAAGSRNWWLHVNVHAQPRDAASLLQSIGWRPAERANWVKMLRPAGEVDAGDATLRAEVSNDTNADTIVDAISRGFGLPPLFAKWLRALMARRVNDATRAGARWIAAESGKLVDSVNPSLLNMQRCGFERVALRRNLLPPLAIRSSPGTTT